MKEKEIEIPTIESGQNLQTSSNVSSTFMPSNVHNILKRKREAKQNKNTGKIDFTSILDTDIDTNNFLSNEEVQPGSLDINYKEKENQRKGIKTKVKKSTISFLCKEITIISINITSFILFCISFIPLSKYSVILNYFVYPIDKTSFILLCINIVISNFIIFFIKIKKISKYHFIYSLLFYIFVFYITHSSSTINKFDKAVSIYYVYLFLFVHVFAAFFIVFNTLYYNYLKGTLVKTEYLNSLIEYWDSIAKLQKLEKYVNINLDKLITYSSNDKDPFLQKKRQKTKTLFQIFMTFIIMIIANILLYIKKKNIFNCDYWTVTNNDDINICEFPEPEGYCYRSFLKGYFNLNNYKKINCSFERNSKKEKKNFKYGIPKDNNKINTDTKIFAFPLTNTDNKYYSNYIENPKKFSQFVNSDIYDYEKIKSKSEILLDFSKNNTFNGEYPQLKINLQTNEELINSRKQNEDNSLFKNVFMLYLSGVSKNYFNISLPKLNSFINEFLSNNINDYNLKKMKSFAFNKYHSFGTNSSINLLPMFYGSSKKSTIKNNNNLLKYFKDNGYITGQSSDKCAKTEIENISYDDKLYVEYDHENIAISCDHNYYVFEDPYSIEKGPYSVYERCLYGNPMYYYHIEYAKQFWEKYKNNKKFFKLSLTYGRERTESILSYLDEPLYELFFNFYDKGYLNNTLIVILSENGGNLKNILYNGGKYSEAKLDIKYGTFILLMSKSENLNLEKYENLCKNQNMMVTPYDVYYTLINVASGDDDQLKIRLLVETDGKETNENKGMSVFHKIDGLKRNCETYNDDWENNMSCSCKIK